MEGSMTVISTAHDMERYHSITRNINRHKCTITTVVCYCTHTAVHPRTISSPQKSGTPTLLPSMPLPSFFPFQGFIFTSLSHAHAPPGCPGWRRGRPSRSPWSTWPYGCSSAASSRTSAPSQRLRTPRPRRGPRSPVDHNCHHTSYDRAIRRWTTNSNNTSTA